MASAFCISGGSVMAEDIVPALYEKIKSDFASEVKNNADIQEFIKRVSEETAAKEEVSLYAADLGKCASLALQKNLTEYNLPNGRLYWNIAERTIIPILKEVHESISSMAIAVDEYEDRGKGIGIKSQKADFPEQRIRDLVDKMVNLFEEDYEEGDI